MERLSPRRPTVELVVEREFDTSFDVSGLVGAIWRNGKNLSLDIGAAHANGDSPKSFAPA